MPDNIYEHFFFRGSPMYLPGDEVWKACVEAAHTVRTQPEAIAKGIRATAEKYVAVLKGVKFHELVSKFGTTQAELDDYLDGIEVGMDLAAGTAYQLSDNLEGLSLLFYYAGQRPDGSIYVPFLHLAYPKCREIAVSSRDPWKDIVEVAHTYRTALYFRVGIEAASATFVVSQRLFDKILGGS